MEHYLDISQIHKKMIGGYVSKSFKHHVFSYGWNEKLAQEITAINPKRATKRVESYVNDEELQRIVPRLKAGKDFSLRFGVQKTGAGNFGERGDFCLLGASYSKSKLTLHYRSLELFGGLVYDQAIILYLRQVLNLKIKTIIVMAASTHSFALKGNSNEKLFSRLTQIYKKKTG